MVEFVVSVLVEQVDNLSLFFLTLAFETIYIIVSNPNYVFIYLILTHKFPFSAFIKCTNDLKCASRIVKSHSNAFAQGTFHILRKHKLGLVWPPPPM